MLSVAGERCLRRDEGGGARWWLRSSAEEANPAGLLLERARPEALRLTPLLPLTAE